MVKLNIGWIFNVENLFTNLIVVLLLMLFVTIIYVITPRKR